MSIFNPGEYGYVPPTYNIPWNKTPIILDESVKFIYGESFIFNTYYVEEADLLSNISTPENLTVYEIVLNAYLQNYNNNGTDTYSITYPYNGKFCLPPDLNNYTVYSYNYGTMGIFPYENIKEWEEIYPRYKTKDGYYVGRRGLTLSISGKDTKTEAVDLYIARKFGADNKPVSLTPRLAENEVSGEEIGGGVSQFSSAFSNAFNISTGGGMIQSSSRASKLSRIALGLEPRMARGITLRVRGDLPDVNCGNDTTLYLRNIDTSSSNIDLSVNGIGINKFSVPLFVKGGETNHMSLFTSGIGKKNSLATLYLHNPLYTIDANNNNNKVNLSILSKLNHSENTNLFIQGPDFGNSNKQTTLFTQGGMNKQLSLFVGGYPIQTEQISLFIKTQEPNVVSEFVDLIISGTGSPVGADTNLFVKADDSGKVERSGTLFLKNDNAVNKFIPLFVKSTAYQGLISRSIELFIGKNPRKSISLFIKNELDNQNSISLYISSWNKFPALPGSFSSSFSSAFDVNSGPPIHTQLAMPNVADAMQFGQRTLYTHGFSGPSIVLSPPPPPPPVVPGSGTPMGLLFTITQ